LLVAEEHVEIRLEVDPESDPIRGLVHDRRGARRDFHGWLQLMAAIEAVRTTELERPAAESPEPRKDTR
jgi:hypothetical protein